MFTSLFLFHFFFSFFVFCYRMRFLCRLRFGVFLLDAFGPISSTMLRRYTKSKVASIASIYKIVRFIFFFFLSCRSFASIEVLNILKSILIVQILNVKRKKQNSPLELILHQIKMYFGRICVPDSPFFFFVLVFSVGVFDCLSCLYVSQVHNIARRLKCSI